MAEDNRVSHEDIYHRLGSLEGKLDSAITKMSDFSRGLDDCYNRIRLVEANVNKAIGIAIVLSVFIPLFITTITGNMQVHFPNHHEQPIVR